MKRGRQLEIIRALAKTAMGVGTGCEARLCQVIARDPAALEVPGLRAEGKRADFRGAEKG